MKCEECKADFKEEFGALSRKDNTTMICSQCGLKQALEWYYDKDNPAINKIMNEHNYHFKKFEEAISN